MLTSSLQECIIPSVDERSTQYIVKVEVILLVNTQLLEDKINSSGVKKGYLAEQLGISIQSFKRKCDNKNEFKLSEADIICKELGITSLKEKEKIFYNL